METKIKRNTIDKYTMILNHLKGLSDQNRLTHIYEILTQFKASQSIGKQIPAKQPEQLEAISPGFDKYTTDEVIQILKNHPEIEIKGPIYIRKEIHL